MKSQIDHLENLISRKVELVKGLQEAIKTNDKMHERLLRNEIAELDAVIAKN